MSFTIVEPAPARLNRSELAVPGSNPKLFEKAAAVGRRRDLPRPGGRRGAGRQGPGPQEHHRGAQRHRLGQQDHVGADQRPRHPLHVPRRGRRAGAGRRPARPDHDPQGRAPPPTSTPSTCWSPRSRTAMGRKKRIGFEMIIETALGMANVDEIAAASKRNESLHFGVADYAASTKARTTVIGGPNAALRRADRQGRGRGARLSLGRHVALRHRPHGGRGARQRPASRSTDPSATSPIPTASRAQANRAACPRLRGQVGDPPEPDRPGQRGQQPLGRRGRQGQAHPRGHGAGPEGRQGRGRARRPPDRHRLDQASIAFWYHSAAVFVSPCRSAMPSCSRARGS